MASATATESALARNLLNSVLALAFPENLATDAAAQELFLAQVPQLQCMLEQHNVFGVVDEGKALDKFQHALFALLDAPPSSLDTRVRAAAFTLVRINVQQCALVQLEQLTPKLMERVLRTVKYAQQQQSSASGTNNVNSLTLAAALDVAADIVRHIDLLTPDVRRELYDSFSRFLPNVLTQLQALGATKKPLARNDVALYASGISVFTALLDVSPNALRIYASKLEHVCALLFQIPAAFQSASEDDGIGARATAAGIECIGLLAGASDKTPQLWTQLVERAVDVAHAQLDQLSGKRPAASISSASSAASTPAGSVRSWLKDTSSDAALPVYQRTELVLQRLALAVAALEALLASRSVSERDVQLVIRDVLALARRALAVRGNELGKQTAVSEDGKRLPASVVFGAVPRVQSLALRCVAAVVARAGICALRYATTVSKVLQLASEGCAHETQAALCDTIAVCVQALGASTVEKLGVPLLNDMLARCERLLTPASATVAASAQLAAAAAVSEKSSRNSNNNAKGKKRKRQAESSVAQLNDTSAHSVPFASRHALALTARTVDAALAAIATCVAVYGAVLPIAVRAAASDLARLAAAQRTAHQFLTRATASAAATNASHSARTGGVDAVALLLLSDAVSADATGAHGTGVVASMHYWHERMRHSAVLAGVSPFGATLQRIALRAGDALLHPRAPPLAIALPDASDAAAATAAKQQRLLSGYPTATAVGSGAAASAVGVRGHNDWNDGVDDAADDAAVDDVEMVNTAVAVTTTTTTTELMTTVVTTDVVVATDVVVNDEVKDDEDDDEYDDVRPIAVDDDSVDTIAAAAVEVVKVVAAANADDSDDDDEFPDIVDDDGDDDDE